MMNFGFSSLILVAPRNYDRHRASITACQAAPLLDTIIFADSLSEAIRDFEDVIAISGSQGRNHRQPVSLPDWCAKRSEQRRTAIVFGTEDSGFTNDQLDLCREMVTIPAHLQYPSLNLAQAVLLVLYELTRGSVTVPEIQRELPVAGDLQQLDSLVETALTASGFYHTGTPTPVPGAIANILRRADMDARELRIMMGVFGKFSRVLKRLQTTFTG